eukprot:scaffold115180_cov121-Phaeocystis_antarctica.AAC.1
MVIAGYQVGSSQKRSFEEQLDLGIKQPTICPPCEEPVETNEAANMAAAGDQETDDLVHIEDVSRKTTIGEILKIAADGLHYLGFPKMDLKMVLLLSHAGKA